MSTTPEPSDRPLRCPRCGHKEVKVAHELGSDYPIGTFSIYDLRCSGCGYAESIHLLSIDELPSDCRWFAP